MLTEGTFGSYLLFPPCCVFFPEGRDEPKVGAQWRRDDRERERDVRRQLSADARAFHFSGNSSSADGDDADGDSLPYHRKSLGERLYPRVHALQPVSSVVYSFKMLE